MKAKRLGTSFGLFCATTALLFGCGAATGLYTYEDNDGSVEDGGVPDCSQPGDTGTKDSGKDAMEHKQGAFDDRVRAGAMSYITFHTYDDLAERSQRRYAAPQSKKTNKGVCRANTVTIGDGWE